jgi:hypothetical protein
MGTAGKSDLYMVALEGWKDRYEGRAYEGQAGSSGYGSPPRPHPRVGGWESLLIRWLHN